MIDRHVDGLHLKCKQRIDWTHDTVQIPCFCSPDGRVTFLTYHIIAVTYHIGSTPNSGHYRTALKYHGQWLVYDDNKLPDQHAVLPDTIHRNCNMIWLLHATHLPARVTNERAALRAATGPEAVQTQQQANQPTPAAPADDVETAAESAQTHEGSHTDGPDTKRPRLEVTGNDDDAVTRSDELLSCVADDAKAPDETL